MLASQFHKIILDLAIATLVSISKIINCEQRTWENTTKIKKGRPERQEDRGIPIRWSECRLIKKQNHRKKLDSTKRNEKRMKFDSVARVLNPFNEVWFDDTKTDSAIWHSIRRNKTSTFGIDCDSSYLSKTIDIWVERCLAIFNDIWQY